MNSMNSSMNNTIRHQTGNTYPAAHSHAVTNRRSFGPGRPGKQDGYTLLLGLIFILILSVFGAYAMSGSIMQVKMAGNYRDAQVSQEAAEAALRWGEAWLQSRGPLTRPFPCQTLEQHADQNCANPRQVLASNLLSYNVAGLNPFDANDSNWENARDYGIDPGTNTAVSPTQEIPGVKEQPRFLLEQAFVDRDDLAGNPQQGRVFYRVIAAGVGARDTTVSVLQSAVAKRFE